MFKFGRKWMVLVFGVVLLALPGCATQGVQFSQMTQHDPEPGMGRIYIYRDSTRGAYVQPDVQVDGQSVGQALVQGFMYVDRPAGNYRVSSDSDGDHPLSVAVEPGQVRYVRLAFSGNVLNSHLLPEAVDTAQGTKEIQGCHYMSKDR